VRVVRLDNAASVTVRITDRGPFAGRKQGRIIDLSRAAAERLDMIRQGVVAVRLELLN
jgi:rare lipoprotein A